MQFTSHLWQKLFRFELTIMWVQILLFNHLTTSYEINNKTILCPDQINNTQNINRLSIPGASDTQQSHFLSKSENGELQLLPSCQSTKLPIVSCCKKFNRVCLESKHDFFSKLGIKSMHTVYLLFDSSKKNCLNTQDCQRQTSFYAQISKE